jgi:hypothetical protein
LFLLFRVRVVAFLAAAFLLLYQLMLPPVSVVLFTGVWVLLLAGVFHFFSGDVLAGTLFAGLVFGSGWL